MSIIEARDELIDERSVCCGEHGSPSVYILKIEGAMIPMCDACIDELKKELEFV